MSLNALDWAWDQPVRGTRQHVLLALAKKVRPKSEVASPSMPELVEMSGLSETAIRGHIQAMAAAGIIRADVSSGGRRKHSTYVLPGSAQPRRKVSTPREVMGNETPETPQEANPKQTETPHDVRGSETETPHLPQRNPSGGEPVVLRTNGRTSGLTTGDADATPTAEDALFEDPRPATALTPVAAEKARLNKIANSITDRYSTKVMCKYVAVRGIVRKALDHYPAEAVFSAVSRLSESPGMTLTTDTLRIEIEGFEPRQPSAARPGPPAQQQGTARKRSQAFLDRRRGTA